MMKAFFTQSYGDENMQKIKDLGVDITYIPERKLEPDTLIKDYDFLVCFDPFKKIKVQGDRLKWIQLTSKGVSHVPAFLRKPEILITNNLNASAIPIAETIIGYIMYFYKNFATFQEHKKAKIWKPNANMLEMTNKKIVILGTGEIAKMTACKLSPFGSTILGVNTSGREVEGFHKVYRIDRLHSVLEQADILISTLPDTERTKHILNKETLSLTKKDSVFINVSRGAILKEEDLVSFLEKDHFRGVALDVFEEEPLPESSPLWNFDRLLLTPHSSYFSDQFKKRLFEMIYSNIEHFISNKPLCNKVDYSKGY